MTRIDFHTNVADKIAYTCRLVRKARSADFRVVLLAPDRQTLNALDQALWTFSATDFVPHVAADSPLASKTPVILADGDEVDLPHHQILINLTAGTPAHFARFERMFEIISADDDAGTVAGRERYRFYQQRGYPLTHHTAENA